MTIMRLIMRPIMRPLFTFLLILVNSFAIADCPNCTDGLVGSGPVKYVCPLCCGKNESDFPQHPTVPSVGFQDPVPSKAGALDHRKSVVRILSRHGGYASGGSGVVIEHDGKPAVLTARHVVFENGKPGTITVFYQDGTESPAKIVKHDDPFDLALLACEKYGAVAVSVAASPKMGDTITVAGFGPHPHKLRASSGRVVGRGKPMGRHPADFIDVSTPARQGDSGGPMFNAAGEVAGILWGSSNGVTVGPHAGRLRVFLGDRLPERERSDQNSDLKPKSVPSGKSCPSGRCPKR